MKCEWCSQSVEDVGLTKINGYWTCEDCHFLDDSDLEEYEERKRARIAEENEY